MKEFYVAKNGQQEGPFKIDELKDIQKNTMIWYEGLETWTEAGKIEELNQLFKSIPPPIENKPAPPPIDLPKNTDKPKSKPKKAIVIAVTVILITTIGAFGYTKYDSIQTQINRQEEKIRDKESRIQKQEQIERSRQEESDRKKQAAANAQRKADKEALEYELDQAEINLRAAEIKLKDLQKFKLLRSPAEKEQQISVQLQNIKFWEDEVSRLKNELSYY